MNRSGLTRFIRLGQQADPVIIDALRRGAPTEFKPALSYHFEIAGKRMRAAMVVLSCAAAGGRIERAGKPAAVVEMIHNYSLMMDDLIDRGEVRRGRPTVRVVMGDSIALLVGMYYREVLDDLIEQSPASSQIRNVVVKTMKEIIDGERLDLLLEQAGRSDPYLLKNRISNPSFKSYLDMVGKKTASLFKPAGQIGAYAAEAFTFQGRLVRSRRPGNSEILLTPFSPRDKFCTNRRRPCEQVSKIRRLGEIEDVALAPVFGQSKRFEGLPTHSTGHVAATWSQPIHDLGVVSMIDLADEFGLRGCLRIPIIKAIHITTKQDSRNPKLLTEERSNSVGRHNTTTSVFIERNVHVNQRNQTDTQSFLD